MATMRCMHSPPRACPRIASARVSQASRDTVCISSSWTLSVRELHRRRAVFYSSIGSTLLHCCRIARGFDAKGRPMEHKGKLALSGDDAEASAGMMA